MHESYTPVTQEDRGLKRIGRIAIVVAIVVVGAGIAVRVFEQREVKDWTLEQSIATVSAIHPTAATAGAGRHITLPSSIEAWSQAPVYARTNGYLKAWYVDIGTKVKEGQVLALIDTPDVDQQVDAAVANLATAEAQLQLADSTSQRWDKMVAQDAVSKQDAEEKRGQLAVRRSMSAAARADVDRLRTLQNFRRIVAPFDGVVTSRATDVGALIISGNAGARPLFTVADTKKMRVYVRVPQSYLGGIKPGVTATLTVPEYPERSFTATFLNMSEAVSDTSGTMLVQLTADNTEGVLKPGSYAQVDFNLPGSETAVRIPVSAMLFRDSGVVVATVDNAGLVKIKPVKIGQDYGSAVEIASGLTASDLVVDSPPDSLTDGDKVRILQAPDKSSDKPGDKSSGKPAK